MAGLVYSLRVFRFFGEVLRQAGILILGSAVVILGMCFTLGLTCGIEGAYLSRGFGASSLTGAFAAWCDLREVTPYAFGYMMAAKVGTGLVAEIGAMRISDEIDALEVMGISSMVFLCATRLMAAWIVLPFMYMAGIGFGFFGSYLAVVEQVGEVTSGQFFLVFWQFQNPPDVFYSTIKGMVMATVIVIVGCYYGYTASGGPVGVGTATAKSMVFNTVAVHLIGMTGTALFWGKDPRSPGGRLARRPARPAEGAKSRPLLHLCRYGITNPARVGASLWALARRQHWVVTRAQLLELGMRPRCDQAPALERDGCIGFERGVYAVGRPAVSRFGRWMAAVLSCGAEAVLSHSSAAALWEIGQERSGVIEVSVPFPVTRRRPGIVVPPPDRADRRRRDAPARHPGHHARLHPRRSSDPSLPAAARGRDQRGGQARPDRSAGAADGARRARQAGPECRLCARPSTGAPSGSPTRSSSAASCRSLAGRASERPRLSGG